MHYTFMNVCENIGKLQDRTGNKTTNLTADITFYI